MERQIKLEKPKFGYYIRYKDGGQKFLGSTKESAIAKCNSLGDKNFPFKNGRAQYWFEKNLTNGDYFWANVESNLD